MTGRLTFDPMQRERGLELLRAIKEGNKEVMNALLKEPFDTEIKGCVSL